MTTTTDHTRCSLEDLLPGGREELETALADVEDCCADEPTAHQDTLNRYQFIFDRVTVDQIPDRHAVWLGQLEALAGEEDAV